LSRWIGSAELHRWHHSVVQGEALNVSTAVPIWDQVFGTYKAPGAAGPARVGILDLPVVSGWTAWRKLLWAPICSRCA